MLISPTSYLVSIWTQRCNAYVQNLLSWVHINNAHHLFCVVSKSRSADGWAEERIGQNFHQPWELEREERRIQWEPYLFVSSTWHRATGSPAFLTKSLTLQNFSSCANTETFHWKELEGTFPTPPCNLSSGDDWAIWNIVIISHYQMSWLQIQGIKNSASTSQVVFLEIPFS